MEFLGSLLRGNSREDLRAPGELDVDDGRVGALARGTSAMSASDGDGEPGSPLGGRGLGMRARRSGGLHGIGDAMPPDPFPLSQVSAFSRGDSASGLASLLAEAPGTSAMEERAMRKSARTPVKARGGTEVSASAGARASGRGTSKRSAATSAPNAGFKAAAFGRVNAQHGSGDAGDHHGWTYIPKRADRRRAIARFTTAIIRAAGHQSFISREGVGYRKAFDRFLLETYGETFAEGGYWYKNAEIEPFFRVILYVATDGRVNIANDDVKYLFTKKEERQAAEWVLDDVVLAKLGLSARDVAMAYEGKPRKSPAGFVRGTPLKVPPASSMPEEPTPFLEALVRAKTEPGAGSARVMPPPPPRSRALQFPLGAPPSDPASPSGVPLDIQRLFDTIPKPSFEGLSATKSRQMSRQYSSDLARLMSEFNANPSSGDEFVRQYLARSASELDAIAAIQRTEKAAKKTEDKPQNAPSRASKRKR